MHGRGPVARAAGEEKGGPPGPLLVLAQSPAAARRDRGEAIPAGRCRQGLSIRGSPSLSSGRPVNLLPDPRRRLLSGPAQLNARLPSLIWHLRTSRLLP